MNLGRATVTEVEPSRAEVHAEHTWLSGVVVVLGPEVIVEEATKQRRFSDAVVATQYHLHIASSISYIRFINPIECDVM